MTSHLVKNTDKYKIAQTLWYYNITVLHLKQIEI